MTEAEESFSSQTEGCLSFAPQRLKQLLWTFPPFCLIQAVDVFSGWHPKGLLVAHLHEHKAAVNRIRVSDEHSIFATASNDGTVKVWDSQKMEGKTTTTR